MKLGPLDIRRARAAADETPTRGLPEKGASGTTNYGGYLVGHEYSHDLRFPRSIQTYNRMRRSDPAVREAMGHIYAPVENATWEIEPASDDPANLEVAEAVRCSFFEWPSQPFSEYLHQALTHLAAGYMLFETPTQVVEAEIEVDLPVDAGTETKTVRRQWVTWRRFAQRLPETIQKWHVTDGELVSVEQWVMRDGTVGRYVIPADQLLVYVNEREGDDFHGLSLLRTAVKPWTIKETLENMLSVAAERHGVGVNTAYVPDRYRDDETMIDRVEQMMRDLNGGDRPYLVFPGPKGSADQQGRDGFTFEIVTPSSTIPDLVAACEYFRADIKGNVLARFAELGHGSVGARATGDSQSPVWVDALHAVATYIGTVNQTAIRRFVQLNYPNVTRYPKLVAHDLESKNLEEFANSNAKLLTAGAIKADRTYRDFVRKSLGAPDEDDDADEQLGAAQQPLDEDGGQFNQPQPPTPPPVSDPQSLVERERLRERARMAEREADRMIVQAQLAEVTAAVRAIAERQPTAGTQPVVNVQPPDMAVFAATLADRLKLVLVDVAGALAQQSAPTVNVDLAEIHELVATVHTALAREQPGPEITVQAADIDLAPVLDRLEQLTRAVSAQPGPVVNVTPEITLKQPPGRNKRVELRRNPAGELESAFVEEV